MSLSNRTVLSTSNLAIPSKGILPPINKNVIGEALLSGACYSGGNLAIDTLIKNKGYDVKNLITEGLIQSGSSYTSEMINEWVLRMLPTQVLTAIGNLSKPLGTAAINTGIDIGMKGVPPMTDLLTIFLLSFGSDIVASGIMKQMAAPKN